MECTQYRGSIPKQRDRSIKKSTEANRIAQAFVTNQPLNLEPLNHGTLKLEP